MNKVLDAFDQSPLLRYLQESGYADTKKFMDGNTEYVPPCRTREIECDCEDDAILTKQNMYIENTVGSSLYSGKPKVNDGKLRFIIPNAGLLINLKVVVEYARNPNRDGTTGNYNLAAGEVTPTAILKLAASAIALEKTHSVKMVDDIVLKSEGREVERTNSWLSYVRATERYGVNAVNEWMGGFVTGVGYSTSFDLQSNSYVQDTADFLLPIEFSLLSNTTSYIDTATVSNLSVDLGARPLNFFYHSNDPTASYLAQHLYEENPTFRYRLYATFADFGPSIRSMMMEHYLSRSSSPKIMSTMYDLEGGIHYNKNTSTNVVLIYPIRQPCFIKRIFFLGGSLATDKADAEDEFDNGYLDRRPDATYRIRVYNSDEEIYNSSKQRRTTSQLSTVRFPHHFSNPSMISQVTTLSLSNLALSATYLQSATPLNIVDFRTTCFDDGTTFVGGLSTIGLKDLRFEITFDKDAIPVNGAENDFIGKIFVEVYQMYTVDRNGRVTIVMNQ